MQKEGKYEDYDTKEDKEVQNVKSEKRLGKDELDAECMYDLLLSLVHDQEYAECCNLRASIDWCVRSIALLQRTEQNLLEGKLL